MLTPSAIVLYVENLEKVSAFYQGLLGINAHQDSSSFHYLPLTEGMALGLKSQEIAELAIEKRGVLSWLLLSTALRKLMHFLQHGKLRILKCLTIPRLYLMVTPLLPPILRAIACEFCP